MRLRDLLSGVGRFAGDEIPDVRVNAIRADSQEVGGGDLFVAIEGAQHDGHDFLGEVERRGAVAAVVERRPADAGTLPVLVVDDSRAALAELAAAWHGCPAESMTLVGITGTVGKTSVLTILERIMKRAGTPIGAIGSLGIHLGERTLAETGFTAPDALVLQEKLAELRDAGCRLLAMEVTSHALSQHRVRGLVFQLGIFTNLLPLEHRDYHGSFEEYVEAKLRFFDHLAPGVPVIYNADDPAVDSIVAGRDVVPVGVGRRQGAAVRIEDARISASGTRLRLRIEGGIRQIDGTALGALDIPLDLKLLGWSNIYNAATAVAIGLVLGAGPAAVQAAVHELPPPRRRVEIIHSGRFTVVDDTAGHPDSVNALFEAVDALDPGALHAVFAVRGSRGPEINRHTAEAFATWARRRRVRTLAVTRSAEVVDNRNVVSEEELEAFLEPLRKAGLAYEQHERLDTAIRAVMPEAGDGDVVLLLGAQGMDAGAERVKEWLREDTVPTPP
ncbi:MAG: Mur ligase family protein [Gemmatimonadota bacterium]